MIRIIRNTIRPAVLLTAMLLVIAACSGGGQSGKEDKASGEKIVYTCTMHPQIVKDKPGKCPICGMELVKKVIPAGTAPASRDTTAKAGK